MFDAVLHWIGFGLCHQIPARSFTGGGYQLPVCARDTGIYLGFVVAVIVMAVLDRGRRREALPPAWLLGTGVAALALMGWDGLSSYLGLRVTTNLLRLATGTGVGFALALVIVPVLNAQLWVRRSPERVLASSGEGIAWLFAAVATFAVTWWGGSYLGAAYPALVALAVLVTFTMVDLVIVSLMPPFERRAERVSDLWLPVALALVLALLEIAAAGWLRTALLSLLRRV